MKKESSKELENGRLYDVTDRAGVLWKAVRWCEVFKIFILDLDDKRIPIEDCKKVEKRK